MPAKAVSRMSGSLARRTLDMADTTRVLDCEQIIIKIIT
jgi:hypothetical protein